MLHTTEDQLRAWMKDDPDITITPPDATWHRPALVRRLRQKLHLTQQAFADRYGIPVTVVRDWEQHRTKPDVATTSYLAVIAADPDGVARHIAAREAAE